MKFAAAGKFVLLKHPVLLSEFVLYLVPFGDYVFVLHRKVDLNTKVLVTLDERDLFVAPFWNFTLPM